MEWRGVTSALCNTELFEESTQIVDVLLKIITKDVSCPLNDTPTHHLKEESVAHKISAQG
jgi:hypothetical protein